MGVTVNRAGGFGRNGDNKGLIVLITSIKSVVFKLYFFLEVKIKVMTTEHKFSELTVDNLFHW